MASMRIENMADVLVLHDRRIEVIYIEY